MPKSVGIPLSSGLRMCSVSRQDVVRIPAFVVLLVGSLLTAWGLWVLYTAIVNYDPQSEIPDWFSWAAAAVLLALGLGLLARAWIEHRAMRRRG
jgi:sulfite exporter TauE/SafE